MAGLAPAIHAFLCVAKTWMPATSAGMTPGMMVAPIVIASGAKQSRPDTQQAKTGLLRR
jgi:hypothetical protein